MKERLRRWLLAKLLGREAYMLQPLPVQAGDYIQLRAKNPERTGNTPELVQVLKVEIHLCDGPLPGRLDQQLRLQA